MPDTTSIYATSAPLLGSLRSKGSTFYTVSTALNDLDKTQLNSNYVMAPSKFVCLNLPQWRQHLPNEQSIFEDPLNIGTPLQSDVNIILPKIIQNYIENGIALSYKERTDDTLQTVAESLFWKMSERLGAMTLRHTSDILKNGENQPVYEEDVDNYPKKDPFVVYVGDINVLNHVTKMGQSYSEIFMHVPTQARRLEHIKFTDPGFTFNTELFPEDGGPIETVGLDEWDNSTALYDTADRKYDFTPRNRLGIYFDDILTTVEEKDKIDGKDFEFNTVLVYYDIWNRENPSSRRTNLYGILFVDSFKDNGAGSSKIETLNKYVPDAVTTGNGYVIRLNLKTTSNQSQTTSEVSINDFSSVSMELYMDALRRLNDVTDLYEQQISYYRNIDSKVSKIFEALPRLLNMEDQASKITELEKLVKTNQQTYRISNEDMFQVFSETVTATQTLGKPINVQMVVGNYQYDSKDGLPIVTDPNNNRWKWNPDTEKWDKLL